MQSAVAIEQRLGEQGASLQLVVLQEQPCLVRAEVLTPAGDKRTFYSGGATLEMARSVAALNAYQAVFGSDEQFAELEREVTQSAPQAVNVNGAVDRVVNQVNATRFADPVVHSSGEGRVSLRRATADDVHTIHELVHALAVYEKAPDAVTTTPETFLRDGFQGDKFFYVILAEFAPTSEPAKRIAVGMALFYISYSTWNARVLYLEDLFVREEYRGLGVGKTLMITLAGVSREIGAARFQWQALDWNEPALNFYAAIGAMRTDEWISLRMYRPTIDKFWQDNMPHTEA